ncbi:MAG: hypothetical protein AAF480_07785 [Actinomycetota bacterium]
MTALDTPLSAPVSVALGDARRRVVVGVFVLASLLGSTLLFLVQPLVGRLLLPRAGGSASLWNTAMVFFQVTLLIGYLTAHVGVRALGVRRHRIAHLALLLAPLAVLPLAVPDGWTLDADRAVLGTLGVLALMVGLPFLALSTASPTLQRWFADTGHPAADDPYFLYAAGNVGAIGSLIGYPLIIEPRLGLESQTWLFTGLYVAFVAATAGCALLTRPHAARSRLVEAAGAQSIAWGQRARWVGLAAIPTALLLGVTRHLATDIASFPLLWAIPLALFLLSFVIAFGDRSERRIPGLAVRVRAWSVLIPLTLLGGTFATTLVVHLGWFFAAATLAHLRLAADRPPVRHLTEFYAWLSVGGALGGGIVALAAPMVFDRVWEYPLAIVAALALTAAPDSARLRALGARYAVPGALILTFLLLAAALLRLDGQLQPVAIALAGAGVVSFVVLRHPTPAALGMALMLTVVVALDPADVVRRERSFFGTYEVHRTDQGLELVSGTTIHGREVDGVDTPTAYYHPLGPLGDVFSTTDPTATAVIGLGVGEIAGYAGPNDRTVFYEIDPVVVDLAEDTSLFTHLQRTQGEVEILVGDGRILVEESTDTFDLLIVDAFSSDAIPVHLLTLEAVQSYRERTDGPIAFHIPNRYFDLEPVLGRIADDLGMDAWTRRYRPTGEARETGAAGTDWVLLTPAGTPAPGAAWTVTEADGSLWTDDYSDLLGTLNW